MTPPQPIPLHTLLPSTDPASIPTPPLPLPLILTRTRTRTLAPLPRRLALASRSSPPSQIAGVGVRARDLPLGSRKPQTIRMKKQMITMMMVGVSMVALA